MAPRDWGLLAHPPPAIVLVLLVDFAAVAVMAVSSWSALSEGLAERQLWQLLVLLGACVAFTELSGGVQRARHDTPHVDLHSVWFFAGVLLLPPALTGLVVAVAGVHRWLRVGDRPAHRRVFAAASTVLAVHLASALPVDLDSRTPAAFAVVVLAGAVYQLASFAPIAAVIAMTNPGDKRRALGNARDHCLESTTVGLGLLLAWALVDWPVAALVVAGVTPALHGTVLIRQLQDSARTDPKTGVLNATGFTEFASRQLARPTPAAVLVLDIDCFKPINDRFGHPAGDAVIAAVATTITNEIRPHDAVARWGGDEMVVLLPATTGDEAMHVAERIRARVHDLAVHTETRLGTERLDDFTVSIGIADRPTHGHTLEALLQAADNACYDAKSAGRNRVAYHAPGLRLG